MENKNIFSLDDRIALVTGAGTGLGCHFSQVLARAGAKVVLTARREEKLKETAASIGTNNDSLMCISMDVTSVDSIHAAMARINDEFGPVDILVNNAGVNAPASAKNLSEEAWDQIVDTNLKGCFLLSKEVANGLIKTNRDGSIINITSVLGQRVQKEIVAYSASKSGLIRMTQSLALEWARYKIRVNALNPGFFLTEITEQYLALPVGKALIDRIPQQRAGDMDELTWPLLLLASDAGSYITGSTLTVDGGLLSSAL